MKSKRPFTATHLLGLPSNVVAIRPREPREPLLLVLEPREPLLKIDEPPEEPREPLLPKVDEPLEEPLELLPNVDEPLEELLELPEGPREPPPPRRAHVSASSSGRIMNTTLISLQKVLVCFLHKYN